MIPLLTIVSLKSLSRMLQYPVRESIKSWNSSDHKGHARNMTQIPVMSCTVWYVVFAPISTGSMLTFSCRTPI